MKLGGSWEISNKDTPLEQCLPNSVSLCSAANADFSDFCISNSASVSSTTTTSTTPGMLFFSKNQFCSTNLRAH